MTDIREQDRVVDGADKRYSVEFVSDEAGQGDHYKVYLKYDGPKGD